MMTSNGYSQFLEKLKAIEASRERRKAWRRIYDLVEPAINVLAEARRKKKFYNQATRQLENR